MSDANQQFSPEVIEQAKRLLEIRERILDAKRNLPNAAYPAQLRDCMSQLIIAFELAIFGKLTDAGPSQIPGTPAGPSDGGQRVQIFMPTSTVPSPEQPAVEILRPMATAPVQRIADSGTPAALRFAGSSAPEPTAPAPEGSVEAAMEILSNPQVPQPPKTMRPIMGSMSRGEFDSRTSAAMDHLSALAPSRATPGAPGTASQHVEIFAANDPRAPQPAKAG